MAVVHRTTLTPGKLELVAAWLPGRPWYRGTGAPDLSRAGGFRLDDPDGEVGIEFMVVNDRSGAEVVSYHVPVTYRGAPLDGAESALIGTGEHGVLGKRWVYDGEQDAVLVDQLLALLRGAAEPQMQSESNTADLSVVVVPPAGALSMSPSVSLSPSGSPGAVRLQRVLQPMPPVTGPGPIAPPGSVIAGWTLPDGTAQRGAFVLSDPTDDRPA